ADGDAQPLARVDWIADNVGADALEYGCCFAVGGSGEEDKKFVAPVADQAVTGPEAADCALRNRADDGVACRVTVDVVDRLQVVQVGHGHGEVPADCVTLVLEGFEPRGQPGAAQCSGQFVSEIRCHSGDCSRLPLTRGAQVPACGSAGS